MLLYAEGSRDLASVIDIVLFKHRFLLLIFNNIALRIDQIAPFVNLPSKFVDIIAILILEQYDVALFVSIKLTQYIVLIECAFASLRWNLHFGVLSLLTECGLLRQLLQHLLFESLGF